MQIIYALPFIFLSLLGFAVFVGVPALRRLALAALIAPVAFGFCSLAGWIGFALIDVFLLHLRSNSTGWLTLEGLLFYLTPGMLGAWLAVRVVRFLESRFLTTRPAKEFLMRSVVSSIAGLVGFIVGAGISDDLLPQGSIYLSFIAGLVSAGVFAIVTFMVVMMGQRKTALRKR